MVTSRSAARPLFLMPFFRSFPPGPRSFVSAPTVNVWSLSLTVTVMVPLSASTFLILPLTSSAQTKPTQTAQVKRAQIALRNVKMLPWKQPNLYQDDPGAAPGSTNANLPTQPSERACKVGQVFEHQAR